MQYKLVVVAGEAKQPELIIKPPTVIGRSRDADITLGHPLVSRRHCEITLGDDGLLVVEDLGSLNGTFHGDERITEAVYLEPGDLLTIGSVTFRAQYGENGAANDVADFSAVDESPKGTKTVTIDADSKPAGKGKRDAAKVAPQPEPAAAESDSFDAIFSNDDSSAEVAEAEEEEVAEVEDPLADFSEEDEEVEAADEVAVVEEAVEEEEIEEIEEEVVEELESVDEEEPAAAIEEVEEDFEDFEELDEPVASNPKTVPAPASPAAKSKQPAAKPSQPTPPAKAKPADDFDMGWLSGNDDDEEEGEGSGVGRGNTGAEGDGDLDDFFKNLG